MTQKTIKKLPEELLNAQMEEIQSTKLKTLKVTFKAGIVTVLLFTF